MFFFSQIIGFYLSATQSEMVDLHLLEFDVNYAWTKSFEPAPSETRRLSEEVEKSQTLVWSYPLISYRGDICQTRRRYLLDISS